MLLVIVDVSREVPDGAKEDECRACDVAEGAEEERTAPRETAGDEGDDDGRCELAEHAEGLLSGDAVDEFTALTPVGREHDLRQVHVVGHMVEPDEVELVGGEGEDDDGEEEPERAGQPLPRGEGEEEGQEARPAPDAKELAEDQREHFARGHLGLIG